MMGCFNCITIAMCVLAAVALSNAQSCPRNERYVRCVNFCNTCENPDVCYPSCFPGCDCIPGFLRNKHGACIPKPFCPGRHELADQRGLGCPDRGACANSCADKYSRIGICIGIGNLICICI